MTNTEKIRLEIAKYLYSLEPIHVDESWEETTDKEEFLNRADQILSIKEIHIEAQDQELDYNEIRNRDCHHQCHDAERRYMISQGFIKVEPKS